MRTDFRSHNLVRNLSMAQTHQQITDRIMERIDANAPRLSFLHIPDRMYCVIFVHLEILLHARMNENFLHARRIAV